MLTPAPPPGEPSLSPHSLGDVAAQSAQHVNTLFELDRWADVIRLGTPLLAQAEGPQVWLQVIHAHWMQGHLAQAKALANQGRGRWPHEVRFWHFAAELDLALGLRQQARTQAQQGLALAPDFAPLHGLLGRLAYFEQDHPAAQAHLRQALALEPTEGLYHYQLAAVLWDSGQTEPARLSLAQALQTDPTHADYLALHALFVSQGVEGEHGGNRQAAITALQQSLRTNPLRTDHQHMLRRLTTGWRLDVALTALGPLLTTWVAWGAWWEWGASAWPGGSPLAHLAVTVVNLLMGLRLRHAQGQRLLAVFCVFNMAVVAASGPKGLLARCQADGVTALWSLDALTFVVGTALMAWVMWVLLRLVYLLVWDNALQVHAFGQEALNAQRQGVLSDHVRDLARRKGVQYNLGVALATMACLMPPVNLAMSLVLLAFGLPVVAWLLGFCLLPSSARPAMVLVFMLICFAPMLATVLFMASVGFDIHQPALGLQALWALAVGVYGLSVVNVLRRL